MDRRNKLPDRGRLPRVRPLAGSPLLLIKERYVNRLSGFAAKPRLIVDFTTKPPRGIRIFAHLDPGPAKGL
jgi:hypothetical protein